jgi:NAD(P)-dependent dehydrogenase (short-subunit alcohol dehydrogenase family)
MPKRFTDAAVWITGGGTGLGRELALRFAEEGANVAISGRRADRLAEVIAELKSRGVRALAVSCDVTDEQSVARAVTEVVAAFGKLDVAVANAGFGVIGRIENLDADDWRRQFETNVVGVANTARYAVPHLRATRGRLVIIGSVAGEIVQPGAGAYHASKHAVRVIGETLAMELHADGVSVTTIQPGFVASEIAQVDNKGNHDPSRADPRPAKVMWPTERASRVMLDAIARRKRLFTFTGHGRLAAFVGRHFPGLVHLAMTRGAVKIDRRSPPSGA